MNIPLSVLVQALDALEALNTYDVRTAALPADLWRKVIDARAHLGAHVRPLTETVKVEVEA